MVLINANLKVELFNEQALSYAVGNGQVVK